MTHLRCEKKQWKQSQGLSLYMEMGASNYYLLSKKLSTACSSHVKSIISLRVDACDGHERSEDTKHKVRMVHKHNNFW